ncbi:hypothetical protein [Pseudoalteromonas sp. P1-9]|uniref:hypothetical protein n=1 Tax=Pseudoalteromonas sp. P1-9 TaxID=1710354 RepID=UPI0006D614ED|nr:hypothetical protein [Pseudoalteromonas sp. P1-9]
MSYIEKQYIGDGLQGHHPINISFGGAKDQKLIFLPAKTHRMFHLVLDVMLKEDPDLGGKGNWTKSEDWESVSRTIKGRKRLYKHIFNSAKLIDSVCELKRKRKVSTFVRINRDKFLAGKD